MNLDASLDLRVEPAPVLPPVPKPVQAVRTALWQLMLKQAAIVLLMVIFGYGVFQFATHFVIQSVQVIGASMTPTLHDSGRYVLNRWIYRVRDPKPQEIVVLRDPADNCYAVKRIIAKEGDTVHVKEGHLFVNGKLLSEPYLPPDTATYPGPKVREQLWICGVNQYFVLGDNRNNSADSRVYGTVSRQNILGMVMP
jgi:signal peptidase I